MCGCGKSIKKNHNYIRNTNIVNTVNIKKNQNKTIKELLEEQQKILGVVSKK